MSGYYDLLGTAGMPAAPSHEELSAQMEFTLRAFESDENELSTGEFEVQGIHCSACVWLLQTVSARTPGMVATRINPALGRAVLTWRRGSDGPRAFLRAAGPLGYRFAPLGERPAQSGRSLLLRLGICVAIAMQIMTFSLAGYFGLEPQSGLFPVVIGWISFALAGASVLVGGWEFFRGAIRGARQGVAHLDLPISLGIAGAFLGSAWAFLSQGASAAYFDSLAVFVALMLAGRWLQVHTLERNRRALLSDQHVAHLRVRRQGPDGLEFAAAADLVPGDELLWVSGEFLPVVALGLDGPVEVSLEWITGESDRREIPAGEPVPAGSRLSGPRAVRLQVAEPFDASRVHALLTRTREGGESGPEFGSGWSRLSRGYVLAVLVLSAAGFGWGLREGISEAIQLAVSILVVTCPCALGLAVPLARELAVSRLRRQGVFLRRERFLDRAPRVRQIFFDKTGTLTTPRAALDPATAGALQGLPPKDLRVLRHLAARSNHPVCRAVSEALGSDADALSNVPVAETTGAGLACRVGDATYRLGSGEFTGQGASGTHFTRDGVGLASLRFVETPREDALHVLASLRARGYGIHILSGDDPGKTRDLGARLGLDPARVAGGLTPEEKAAQVRRLDRRDTLLVGDGLNDGPAADAAYTAGTPAVDHPALPARADFYYLGDGIGAVEAALMGALDYRRVVRGNVILALAYNACAVGLCFAGWITPLTAAVLMPLSSLAFVALTRTRMSERRRVWMSW